MNCVIPVVVIIYLDRISRMMGVMVEDLPNQQPLVPKPRDPWAGGPAPRSGIYCKWHQLGHHCSAFERRMRSTRLVEFLFLVKVQPHPAAKIGLWAEIVLGALYRKGGGPQKGGGGGGKTGSVCHFAFPLSLQCLGVPRYPNAGKKTARQVSLSHPLNASKN